MNSQPFFRGLKKHFNITKGANEYLCPTSLITGKVSIDTIKLDDWLHKQVGDYEKEEGLSMKESLSKYYGEAAASFVENMI